MVLDTRADINLEDQWTLTTKNVDGSDDRILIFSTDKNLSHLLATNVVYGDGIFNTSPDLLTQIYSCIHWSTYYFLARVKLYIQRRLPATTTTTMAKTTTKTTHDCALFQISFFQLWIERYH